MSENLVKLFVSDYETAYEDRAEFETSINGVDVVVETLPIDLPEDDFPLYIFLDDAGDVAAIEFTSGKRMDL
jgi:hypothetical protein